MCRDDGSTRPYLEKHSEWLRSAWGQASVTRIWCVRPHLRSVSSRETCVLSGWLKTIVGLLHSGPAVRGWLWMKGTAAMEVRDNHGPSWDLGGGLGQVRPGVIGFLWTNATEGQFDIYIKNKAYWQSDAIFALSRWLFKNSFLTPISKKMTTFDKKTLYHNLGSQKPKPSFQKEKS